MRKLLVIMGMLPIASWALAADDPITQWHLEPPRKITVALIDSGVDPGHEDLQGVWWRNPDDDSIGWDFVDGDNDPTDPCWGHGTIVAGLLAANRNNGIGVQGAASPHVELMVVRAVNCNGTSTEQQLVDGINWAVDNGADVIQLSAFVSAFWGIGCWNQPGCVPALCNAIGEAGIPVVSPAGNEGINLDPPNYRYPPSCGQPNQIVVTGHDENGAIVHSFGPNTVHLSASGQNIASTTQLPAHQFLDGDPPLFKYGANLQGSSWSAALTTAAVALCEFTDPGGDCVSTVLDNVPNIGQSTVTGGRLSMFREISIPDPPSGFPVVFDMENVSTCPAPPPQVAAIAPEGSLAGDFSNHYCQTSLFPTGPFRITAWIQLDPHNQRHPIVTKQGSETTESPQRGFTFEVSSDNKLFAQIFTTPTSSAFVQVPQPLVDGVVYEVKLTHDGTVAKIFIDGVERASQTVGLPRQNSLPLNVGRYRWTGQHQWFFNGRLDNVVIEELPD